VLNVFERMDKNINVEAAGSNIAIYRFGSVYKIEELSDKLDEALRIAALFGNLRF
jgi:hypothetical protein